MNCQNSRCFRPSLVHEMILRQLPLPEHFQSFLRLFDQRIYSHHLDRQILSPLTCKVLRQRESYSSIMSIARSFGFGRACPSETMESVPTCRWLPRLQAPPIKGTNGPTKVATNASVGREPRKADSMVTRRLAETTLIPKGLKTCVIMLSSVCTRTI